ncbi:rhodanese-like domain-containing protein [uncultured Limnohabitans sp.]|uniref:rhodanese-like domain-containing protein n=1 Tax=uncultured Limnohabitans sp. TaxID=768543 RepID=UPI0026023674|nr:rhodanese-like domain-containing protein [uncultured Limnohabitans sp.]
MDFLNNYWPLLALALWFGYKWWNARRVVALLPALKQQGATLLDVRSAAEFARASAPGTVNIPLQELAARLVEIPRNAPVVVGCASGTRSGMAKMLLKKKGFAPVHNIGGWSNFMK